MGCGGSKGEASSSNGNDAQPPLGTAQNQTAAAQLDDEAIMTPLKPKEETHDRPAGLESITPFLPLTHPAEDVASGEPSAAAVPVPEAAAPEQEKEEPPVVDWDAVDWKEKLTMDEYKVLREKQTEKRGGEYDDMFMPPEGYFICRGCGSALFSAAAKFKSGCGWPSFDRCYTGAVKLEADLTHGMARREIICATCSGHLGHLFTGEKATDMDQRHCVNSISLKFVKAPPPETLVENGEALDTSAVDKQLKAYWDAVDWKEKLTMDEYKVLREKQTEKRGGEYDDMFMPPEGYFICRGCGSALFSAAAKFKSGCGWPSFDRCYTGAVKLEADLTHGMARREIICATCSGHLGHLFTGEKATDMDQRHCVNSISLKFVKAPPPETLVENGEALDTSAVDKHLNASGTGAGSKQGAASVKPPSDLDLSEPGLAADWAAARTSERGWCMCSYAPQSKSKIVPIARGEGGYGELLAALREREDSVNYAACAASVDGRQRFVFLCYVGASTTAIKKGRAAMHAPYMDKFFDGTAGALPVITSSEELETNHVNGLLLQLCKGSKEALMS